MRLLKSRPAKVDELVRQAVSEAWNWEECCYHLPGDHSVTAEQFWFLVKLARMQNRAATPARDAKLRPFSFSLSPNVLRVLHLVDKGLGGPIESLSPRLDSQEERDRYLITSLQEEAIASSQIEGAVVTREVAKQMLLTGRKPRDQHEQMILNNYRTIRMLNEFRHQPMSVPLLLEIQRQLTENAIDEADAAGRLRRPGERIVVWDDESNQPLHVPPDAESLPARLELLCDYANERNSEAVFVHPVIRAIVLHFWLAYDHPFVDGNGRTARALFYWSMLRSGYWLVEYLSISAIIRNQPKQYARAFLNAEVDENDLDYFIHYHLRVIERSLEAFRAYLDKKRKEQERLGNVMLPAQFNPRQRALLIKALKEPHTTFSYRSHATAHDITLATARADILALEKKHLLRANRVGRQFEFVAADDLEGRLKRLAAKHPGVERDLKGVKAADCCAAILSDHGNLPRNVLTIAREALARGYAGKARGSEDEILMTTAKSFWAAMTRDDRFREVRPQVFVVKSSPRQASGGR